MLNSSQESLHRYFNRFCTNRFRAWLNCEDFEVKPYYVATKMTQKKINWKEYSLMVPGLVWYIVIPEIYRGSFTTHIIPVVCVQDRITWSYKCTTDWFWSRNPWHTMLLESDWTKKGPSEYVRQALGSVDDRNHISLWDSMMIFA